jgi:hypothetical protein
MTNSSPSLQLTLSQNTNSYQGTNFSWSSRSLLEKKILFWTHPPIGSSRRKSTDIITWRENTTTIAHQWNAESSETGYKGHDRVIELLEECDRPCSRWKLNSLVHHLGLKKWKPPLLQLLLAFEPGFSPVMPEFVTRSLLSFFRVLLQLVHRLNILQNSVITGFVICQRETTGHDICQRCLTGCTAAASSSIIQWRHHLSSFRTGH